MVTDAREREWLKQAYPFSKSWAEKVDKMSADQVVAVYLRFKREGKVQ